MGKEKLTEKQKQNKVYDNSSNTCVYISGKCEQGSKIHAKCLIHNIEFEISYDTIRKITKPRYICPECKRVNRNRTRRVNCDFCGKEFILKRYSFENNEFHFCCRKCKDFAQRLSSGEKFNSMRPYHYGNEKFIKYRKYAFDVYPHKCAICGWNEDENILQVHHIDFNRGNNNIDNLIILCPNCHAKLSSHKYELKNKKIIKKGLGTA